MYEFKIFLIQQFKVCAISNKLIYKINKCICIHKLIIKNIINFFRRIQSNLNIYIYIYIFINIAFQIKHVKHLTENIMYYNIIMIFVYITI